MCACAHTHQGIHTHTYTEAHISSKKEQESMHIRDVKTQNMRSMLYITWVIFFSTHLVLVFLSTSMFFSPLLCAYTPRYWQTQGNSTLFWNCVGLHDFPSYLIPSLSPFLLVYLYLYFFFFKTHTYTIHEH